MTADRPIRLTFPAVEPGFRDIVAGDVRVGFATADFYHRWTARLFVVAGTTGGGYETATFGDVGAMRETLRDRVAVKGPWWVAPCMPAGG